VRFRPTLVVLALATSAIPLAATPVQAGETGPAATVTLRTVNPAAPKPGDELVLAGVIENTGDEPLGNVVANLRYSALPLDDRAQVHRVAIDDDVRWGQRDGDFFEQVETELMAPGEAAEFALRIPVDEINFSVPGVYAVGVDIRAEPVDGERITLATARTVIPWLPDPESVPSVPVALLWPLGAQPALLPDSTLLGDGLAGQLGPDGALTALVEAPGTAPVTWVVDPDLMATVAAMADGYAVTTQDGITADGTGAASAEAWLSAVSAATDGDELFLLPYADPDLSALARADDNAAADTATLAFAATTDWASQSTFTGNTEIAWPGGGVADDPTLAALGSAGASTVVLARDAVIGATDTARVRIRTDGTTLDAVLTDNGLESAVAASAAADPLAGITAMRQAWLAETALTALAARNEAARPGALVGAPPSGWQPLPAAAQALVDVWTTTPWTRPVPLSGIPVPPRAPVVAPDPAATATPPELPPEYMQAVFGLRRDSARYAAVLAEPDGLVDELPAATLRALATTWREAPEAGANYTSVVTAEVESRLGEVSILVPESVTLSSEKGTFPLTVSNGLQQPVLVSVAVVPDYPDRMSVAGVAPQRVEAGENATVEVTAEANANGRMPVTVRLTAADGSALGPPQRMVVNATDYGNIGWVVIGVAVALFLAAAILRVIRARRPRANMVEVPETALTASEAMRETAR
jgi:Family of unknown function (DUF6049)